LAEAGRQQQGWVVVGAADQAECSGFAADMEVMMM